MIASNDDCLIGLWFEGQRYIYSTLPTDLNVVHEDTGDGVLEETSHWLDEYFAGHIPSLTPKMKLIGTDFRKLVWEYLLTIPYGNTMTYGQIASELGIRSARAVGNAVGHNPISIIIPCHRVMGANNAITGYAAGIDKKEKLLLHERLNAQAIVGGNVGTQNPLRQPTEVNNM